MLDLGLHLFKTWTELQGPKIKLAPVTLRINILPIFIKYTLIPGSNHYGLSQIYVVQAIVEGLIGFTCTNSPVLMVPTRAKKAALGSNPLSLGAPASCGDSFILDMSTTAVAAGKIICTKIISVPYRTQAFRKPKGTALSKIRNN